MPRSALETRSRIALLGFLALDILAVGACAQATAGAPSSSRNEAIVDIPATSNGPTGPGPIRYRRDVESRAATLSVPVSVAWARASHAYTALKLPITTIDTARHVIGAENAAVQNRLAGDRMSRWLSCGVTPIGLPRADSYVVSLTVLTQVLPDSAGSVARTIVTGSAQPADGTTNGVQCSSTGELEKRLQAAMGAS